MSYETLCEELERRELERYANKDSITPESGGFSGGRSYRAEAIRQFSFAVDVEEAEALDEVEDELLDLELMRRDIEEYRRNLVGLDEFYRDPGNGLMVEMHEGYLFPLSDPEIYYKGFGYPEVFDEEDGVRMLELREEDDKIQSKAILSFLGLWPSLPLSWGLAASGVDPKIGMGIGFSYIAGLGAYMVKQIINRVNVRKEMGEVPRIEGREAVRKLCETYQIDCCPEV